MKRSYFPSSSTPKYITNPYVDLFSEPPVDMSVTSGEYIKLQPIYRLDDEAPVTFRIEKGGSGYLDLNDSFLYVKARILREDGTVLAANDVVATGNLFLHSRDYTHIKHGFRDNSCAVKGLNQASCLRKDITRRQTLMIFLQIALP